MRTAVTASIALVIGLCFVAASSNAAHILGIFPILAKSHFSCNYAVLRSLHAAGHRVTMVTAFPTEEQIENFTIIVPPSIPISFLGQSTVNDWIDTSPLYLMDWGGKLGVALCESVMSTPEIQDALHSSEKLYDVLMGEYLFDFNCYLPIAEKLGIPVIATTTLHGFKYADYSVGVPNNPAIIPHDLYNSISVEMNFLQRLTNVWYYLVSDYYYFRSRAELMEVSRKYISPEFLNRKYVSLIFYNNHPSMLPRPTVPNAIEIGGIHVPPARPLPKDIQKFIDEAPHGVILFSLGSVVQSKSMAAELKREFLSAFASIPQRVIWKFEKATEDISGNILMTSWLPQRDILEHKNVIAFMSHCGQSGTYEAVVTGTPVVTIPLFGDQQSNAALLIHRGVGVNLDYKTATREKILAALNAIVNDTRSVRGFRPYWSVLPELTLCLARLNEILVPAAELTRTIVYYERMQELSRLFKDRPMSPQELVVYWTEYVIRHNGAPHLRAIGTDTPFYKYFMLDIIAISLLIASLIVTLTYTTVRQFYVLIPKNLRLERVTKKDE